MDFAGDVSYLNVRHACIIHASAGLGGERVSSEPPYPDRCALPAVPESTHLEISRQRRRRRLRRRRADRSPGAAGRTPWSQHSVAALEAHVLNVGRARLAHPQTVQAEQNSERSVSVVEPFRGEEEPSEFSSVQSAPLAGVHGGSAHVLRRVGREPSVDMRSAVEPARRRQPPVDRRSGQTAFLHP